MRGRTIKIHLVEGTPNDVTTAEIIASWTGKVILAPRARLAELAKRPEVQRSGIYILVGDDPNNPGREQVYVGESENVLSRLKQHITSGTKEFWNRSIIIVSKDEHLTKSLIRYLESRLIQIVSHARRATLDNGAMPDCPKLPESDVADMEYFLDQIQMLLPVLDFTFVLPIPDVPTTSTTPSQASTVTPPQTSDLPEFVMTVAGADAKAREVRGEFVILKGSFARDEKLNALSRSYIELRKQLVQDNKLRKDDQKDLWVFMENVPFKSTSAAASIVAGTNKAGPGTWLVKGTKQTYQLWQAAQVNAQSAFVTNVTDDVDSHDSQ